MGLRRRERDRGWGIQVCSSRNHGQCTIDPYLDAGGNLAGAADGYADGRPEVASRH